MLRLKLLREKHGDTQEEVARYLGAGVQTYRRYEEGTGKLSIKRLVQLAEYYGVSADYILGLKDDPHA